MNKYIEGKTGKWEYVIGLEVHAQVKSKSKLFSSASTSYGSESNQNVNLFDIALPGTLPVLNEYCVRQAVKTGLGINGQINRHSSFDRKNYFYPDLPSGYQISQFFSPIVKDAWIEIYSDDGKPKKINIRCLHLEQDAGKSLHDYTEKYTCLDFNRAGIALMEIVSQPELSSPKEAAEYLKKLRTILRYLDTCDGDMEKGSMRCDANVSVRKLGNQLGTRCEIKNVNSIKNVMKAIEYEALRQVEIIESGGEILQETRLFNADQGKTYTMRSKEEAEDYRYFPEPDLTPVLLSEDYIQDIKKTLPELPDIKLERYVREYNISRYDAEVLTSDKKIASYYEEVIKTNDPKLAANWIISELFYLLNKNNKNIENNPLSPKMLIDLLTLIENKTISGKIGKIVLEDMFISGKMPATIIKEKNLIQISDPSLIRKIIVDVINNNPDAITQLKAGKTKTRSFLVGQIMKESKGKANPELANKLLQEELININKG